MPSSPRVTTEHSEMAMVKNGAVSAMETVPLSPKDVGVFRFKEEVDDERKQDGDDFCGSKWTSKKSNKDGAEDKGKSQKMETEIRPEETEVTNFDGSETAGNEVRAGLSGSCKSSVRGDRSQYHSIQRLLSPNRKSSHHQLGTAGVGGYPSSSSLEFSFPSSITATATGGYFVGRESAFDDSGSLKVFRGMARHPANGASRTGSRNGNEMESADALDDVDSEDWSPVIGKNHGGTAAATEGERSVEVSTNDFVDSVEDMDSSFRSPPTDLSNSSGEDDMSEGEGGALLNDGQGHHRLEEDDEEEDDEEDERKSNKVLLQVDDEVTSCPDDAVSFSDSTSFDDSVGAKKARMESIVTNMKRSPSSTSNEINQPERIGITEPRRPKRKQYIPKQHDACRSSLQVIVSEPERPPKKIRGVEKEELHQELRRMQERLADMKEKYFQIFGDQECRGFSSSIVGRKMEEEDEAEAMEAEDERFYGTAEKFTDQGSPSYADAPAELKQLAGLLKTEISNSVGTLVDEIVKSFLERHRLQAKEMLPVTDRDADSTAKVPEKPMDASGQEKMKSTATEAERLAQSDNKPLPFLHQSPFHQSSSSLILPQPVRPLPPPPPPPPPSGPLLSEFANFAGYPASLQPKLPSKTKLTDKYIHPFFDSHSSHPSHKMAFDIPRAHLPIFPHHSFYHHHSQQMPVMAAAAAAAAAAAMFNKEPEQTEALPLIVNTPTKKKRTKVTDTRLSPRAARAILQENVQAHHRHQPYQVQGREDHVPLSTDHHHPSAVPGGGGGGGLSDQGRSMINDDLDPDQDSFFGQFHNNRHPHPHLHHPNHHHHHVSLHALLPVTLPTSVAIPNPSLQHSDIMQAIYGPRKHHHRLELSAAASAAPSSGQRFAGSVGLDPTGPFSGRIRSASSSPEVAHTSSDGFSGAATKTDSIDNYDSLSYDEQSMTSTLTPMHLRKAKLMFFYVRYPSSAILKIYFPDVKFNKNNTAQLIKWFSNFREFYYIQMEKYARQALAEGVKYANDLVVNADSELYRVLVLHYNRNNRIEVPDSFRQTVQATLREFFNSIEKEKDQEPSWKKSIYKIIAQLDDTVPEYFKSPNWMEQLADG